MNIVPLPNAGPPTLYLGLSGVVHPSESMYRFVHGHLPWDEGHSRFEGVPALERALAPWPDLRIILTSALPKLHGIGAVLASLGPTLAGRVDGFTFEDITTKVTRDVPMRSGGTRRIGYGPDDYRRMNKADMVAVHVAWRRPVAWIAIDDEDILWPFQVRQDRLVLTHPCLGLLDPSALDRLLTVLEMNLGAAAPSELSSR